MDSTTCGQSPVWAYFDKLSNGKAFCKEVLYWFKIMIFFNISSFRGRLAVEELVVLKENRKLLRDFQRNSEYKMSEANRTMTWLKLSSRRERARLTILWTKRSLTSSMMIWRRSGWRRRRSTDFLLSTWNTYFGDFLIQEYVFVEYKKMQFQISHER